jgi:Transmembrane domain of unknown function (DUF3566)
LDRGTDRPDGSGGGTPTVVTSRATDDDLTGDERETRPSGVMAPPRQPSPKRTAARSASADPESQDDAASDGTAGGGVSANGVSAGAKDSSANRGPAAVDDTIADGVPALPADTISSARGTRSKGSDPGEGPAGSAADDSPVAGGDSPTSPLGTEPSGVRSSGPASSGTVPPGRRSSSADSPAVSPASFGWEMPDPPSNSTSSATRNFLRSGLALGGVAAKGGSSGTSQDATGEGLAAARGTAQKPSSQQAPSQKAQSKKAKSKRSARQAHLTIARVEPWSVMKFSFVVSLVAFVILFVAVSLLYGVLSAVGVFDSLQRVVTSITSSQGTSGVNAKVWFSASKVLGYTALLGSLNIVLITAMATIGSVVYNLTSRLVGGVEVTLRETE